MTVRPLLTFEQFEQIYDINGMKHKLLEGELITVPPPKIRQVVVRDGLADALRPHVEQHRLGAVYVRAGSKLSSDTWLQPDASFIRTAHLDRTDPDGYFEGSPAIESNSPPTPIPVPTSIAKSSSISPMAPKKSGSFIPKPKKSASTSPTAPAAPRPTSSHPPPFPTAPQG